MNEILPRIIPVEPPIVNINKNNILNNAELILKYNNKISIYDHKIETSLMGIDHGSQIHDSRWYSKEKHKF